MQRLVFELHVTEEWDQLDSREPQSTEDYAEHVLLLTRETHDPAVDVAGG